MESEVVSPSGTLHLKLLTLNCWAVPFGGCSDLYVRLNRIGDYLAQSQYDIVFLEEVWTPKYLDVIERRCEQRFPFRRCFRSGRVGTAGLCIFSKHPIVTSMFHSYMLNGYWYMMLHGDNHVCKGVGFARLLVNGTLTVDCFISHLHAEYDREKDWYAAHRTCQALEIAKFVRLVSLQNPTPHMTIVAGDMNLEPVDLGLRAFVATTGLSDSWVERFGNAHGATCDLPNNPYTPSSSKTCFPKGRRIDYVFYRGTGINAACTECQVMDSPRLSDHEGIEATFAVSLLSPSKSPVKSAEKEKDRDEIAVLNEVENLLESSIATVRFSATMWLATFVILCALALMVLFLEYFYFPSAMTSFVWIAVAFGIFFVGVQALIVKRTEYTHLFEMLLQVRDDLSTLMSMRKS